MTLHVTISGLHEISHFFRNKANEALARERVRMNGPPRGRPTSVERAKLQTEQATWRAAAEFVESCQLAPLTQHSFNPIDVGEKDE